MEKEGFDMKTRHRVTSTKQRKPAFQPPPRRSSPFPRWLAAPAISVALITAFGACGNGKPSGVVETVPIAECDAYASAYHACMSRVGAAASGPAERHLMTLRQEVSASPSDEAERERLRSSCVFGMRQLELACR
jgi:hypothetical protein